MANYNHDMHSVCQRVFEALKEMPEGMTPRNLASELGKRRDNYESAMLTMEFNGMLLSEDDYGMIHAYKQIAKGKR